MPDLIDDTALETFAIVGEPHEVGRRLQDRFGHLATSIALYQYAGAAHGHCCPSMTASVLRERRT